MAVRAPLLTEAVVWSEGGGEVHTGTLELAGDRLEIAGSRPGGALAAVHLPYDDLESVRIGRSRDDRIGGAPALVLERRSGPPIRLGSLGPGGIFEAGDLLAGLMADRRTVGSRLAVVVPIRRGSREHAQALVEQGPPFDPEGAPFDRHHVFVTEREVVFVFEGTDVREAAERLLGDPSVWRAAAAWRRCLAGAPRIASEAYGWSRDTAA